jgi:hypothetical protein
MGGASTGGGGGGVGPAGMTGTTVVAGKTQRNYGTAKNAKSTSNRHEGNTNNSDGGQGANILIAPTVAEVSQSQAANATTAVDEKDPLYLRKKKTQAKGRSATILTSSKGVNEDSTLGKKSLLGA